MRTTEQISEELRKRSDDIFGLVSCFMALTAEVPEQEIDRFLDNVTEEGEALWLKFTAWRDSQPERVGFVEFVKAINAAA